MGQHTGPAKLDGCVRVDVLDGWRWSEQVQLCVRCRERQVPPGSGHELRSGTGRGWPIRCLHVPVSRGVHLPDQLKNPQQSWVAERLLADAKSLLGDLGRKEFGLELWYEPPTEAELVQRGGRVVFTTSIPTSARRVDLIEAISELYAL